MTVKRAYMMLMVEDMDRAVGFWRSAFGMEPGMQSPGWSELALGDRATLALHKGREGGESQTGLGLQVDDIETACQTVEAAGGRVVSAPQRRPGEGILLATLADSEGNHFWVSQE